MTQSVKQQLITLIEQFVTKYTEYEKNNTIKESLLNDLKYLHNALESFDNFKLLSNDFETTLDKLLINNDIVQICIVIELIFNQQFFTILNHNYDEANDINCDYHSSMINLIFCIVALFEKYIDEDVKGSPHYKDTLRTAKITPYVNCIQHCFTSVVELKWKDSRYDDEVSEIMEILCASDLEEIYANDVALLTYMGLRNKGYKF